MAPSAIEPIDPAIGDVVIPKKDTLGLPASARARLEKAGIDLSEGYPYRPARPLYLQDVYKIRDRDRVHVDAGARADKSKKNLFAAATKVTDLTTHIGTEIEGLQLKDLTPAQKDELALLIAERSVVFFRNQDITPQQQRELGKWYGEVKVHVGPDCFACVAHRILTLVLRGLTAASPPSPRGSGRDRHLARPASHRASGQLPQTRRRKFLALRPSA